MRRKPSLTKIYARKHDYLARLSQKTQDKVAIIPLAAIFFVAFACSFVFFWTVSA